MTMNDEKSNEIMNNVIEIETLSYKQTNIRTYWRTHTHTHTWKTEQQQQNFNKKNTQQINNKYEITFHTCTAIGIIENDSSTTSSTNF